MSKNLWSAIDQHYLDNVVKPDPGFETILSASADAGLPAISVSSIHGQFLELLVRAMGAKYILEIGSLGGFSTAWLARGLPYGGKIISLELDPERAALTRTNLNLFEFKAKVEVWVGDGLHNLSEMVNIDQPAFDLIFIDAEKSQYPEYLDLCIPLSRPGTLIIADNVIKYGKVYNKKIETPSQIGITNFHQKVADDPRLQATVMQTVGEKGHDGFSLILVSSPDLP
jgi:predicted O-methyltransferase YrrM